MRAEIEALDPDDLDRAIEATARSVANQFAEGPFEVPLQAMVIETMAWTYRPQKRQDDSAFALTYILRLRSCKSMDAFVISSLPSPLLEALQMAGPLRSPDITPLHR